MFANITCSFAATSGKGVVVTVISILVPSLEVTFKKGADGTASAESRRSSHEEPSRANIEAVSGGVQSFSILGYVIELIDIHE